MVVILYALYVLLNVVQEITSMAQDRGNTDKAYSHESGAQIRIEFKEYILSAEKIIRDNIDFDTRVSMEQVGLIDTNQVKNVFGMSMEAIRKYKALGLISPVKRVGRKDFYRKTDILRRKELILDLQREGKSLAEITQHIAKNFSHPEVSGEQGDVKKILIIEDDKGFITLIKETIEEHFDKGEIKIYNEENGLAGLDRAIAIRPHLIILDIALPGISGIKLYKQLKEDSRTNNIKVIGMSGVYCDQDKLIGNFLRKPFKTNKLIAMVKRLLE
jgi:CheY-like chemotaxis protein